MGFGSDEQQFCPDLYISLEMLCQTTLMNFGEIDLLEKVFGPLHAKVLRHLSYLKNMKLDNIFSENFPVCSIYLALQLQFL